jgi:hypothetical protein
VRSLLYWYQQGKDYPSVCPLCKVSRTYHPKAKGACGNCLWLIIEGENCSQFAVRKYGKPHYVPMLTFTDRWHIYRKPMLRRWAKVIQAEMDCRTNSVEA